MHGLRTWWYPNGRKRSERNYKDGKKHGLQTEWDKDGQKKRETNYKDGKLVSALSWLPDGSKCPLTNIKEGNGLLVAYGMNEQNRTETTFKDGKQHGLETRWGKDGNVTSQTKWVNGIEVEKIK